MQVYFGLLHDTTDVAIKVVTTPTPAQQKSFVKEIMILKVRFNPSFALCRLHQCRSAGADPLETVTGFTVMEIDYNLCITSAGNSRNKTSRFANFQEEFWFHKDLADAQGTFKVAMPSRKDNPWLRPSIPVLLPACAKQNVLIEAGSTGVQAPQHHLLPGSQHPAGANPAGDGVHAGRGPLRSDPK